MKATGHGRAEQNDGFDIRSTGLAEPLHKFLNFVFRNHTHPQFYQLLLAPPPPELPPPKPPKPPPPPPPPPKPPKPPPPKPPRPPKTFEKRIQKRRLRSGVKRTISMTMMIRTMPPSDRPPCGLRSLSEVGARG